MDRWGPWESTTTCTTLSSKKLPNIAKNKAVTVQHEIAAMELVVKTGLAPTNLGKSLNFPPIQCAFLKKLCTQHRKANPYNFVSTMPYGYGSGAMPFFSDPYSGKNSISLTCNPLNLNKWYFKIFYTGGWPGTSYGPGGYMASSLPMQQQQQPNYNNYPPQPPVGMYRPNDVYY